MRTLPPAPAALPALAALAAVAAVAGCQNPATGVVGAEAGALPDLRTGAETEGTAAGPVRLDGTPVAAGATIDRSIATLDRSSWQPIEVVQPRGQVEVQPTDYRLFEGFSQDARAQGRYPTAATALAVHGEGQTAVQDGLAAPVIGIFWLGTVPIHLVAMPPNTVLRQPEGAIEWLPEAQRATHPEQPR